MQPRSATSSKWSLSKTRSVPATPADCWDIRRLDVDCDETKSMCDLPYSWHQREVSYKNLDQRFSLPVSSFPCHSTFLSFIMSSTGKQHETNSFHDSSLISHRPNPRGCCLPFQLCPFFRGWHRIRLVVRLHNGYFLFFQFIQGRPLTPPNSHSSHPSPTQ